MLRGIELKIAVEICNLYNQLSKICFGLRKKTNNFKKFNEMFETFKEIYEFFRVLINTKNENVLRLISWCTCSSEDTKVIL